MSVARILALKGHQVTTITPERTLLDASKLLSDKGIGALVVLDAQQAILGILSERDIVRAVGRGGPAAMQDPLPAHMTKGVKTCTSSSAINDLMEAMTTGKFRHIPVVENGRLSGIVSIGDVVKYRLAEIEHEHQALREYIASA